MGKKKPSLPTVQEETHASKREGARASWWRINRAKMTVAELSHATGYSQPAIYLLERGLNSNGSPVSPWTMQRYKMACAGVEAMQEAQRNGTTLTFNWGFST